MIILPSVQRHALAPPLSPSLTFPSASAHLKRVVLWRNLPDKVVADDWELLQDIFPHFWDVTEEEQGEDAGYCAEAAGGDGAVARPLANRVSCLSCVVGERVRLQS